VRRWYATEVARAANGVIHEAAIVPSAHLPHVSEPEISSPAAAPAWVIASSRMKARVAVRNTSPKRPRARPLLRFSASTEPSRSLLITGANNDQRVSSHTPGSTSNPVAASGW
jgi:hypothetical protein